MSAFASHSSIRFSLGEVVITPELDSQVPADDIHSALKNHASGNWGELGVAECLQNEYELKAAAKHRDCGPELNSIHTSRNGIRFCITTTGRVPSTFVYTPEPDDVLLSGCLPSLPLEPS